jgi:hypothetical protein
LRTANAQQFQQGAVEQMTREIGMAVAVIGRPVVIRIGQDL